MLWQIYILSNLYRNIYYAVPNQYFFSYISFKTSYIDLEKLIIQALLTNLIFFTQAQFIISTNSIIIYTLALLLTINTH